MLDHGCTAVSLPNGVRGKFAVSACVLADAILEDKLMMPGADDRPTPSLAFNTAGEGAITWVGSLTGAGYLFGDIPLIKGNLSLISLCIIVVTLLPAVIGALRASRQ
jgi:hypothetical protein